MGVSAPPLRALPRFHFRTNFRVLGRRETGIEVSASLRDTDQPMVSFGLLADFQFASPKRGFIIRKEARNLNAGCLCRGQSMRILSVKQ